MADPRNIRVDLGERSYDVTVAAGLISSAGPTVASLARGGRAVIVTDSIVGPLYAGALAESLSAAGLSVATLDFPAGEASKCLAAYGDLANRLLALTPAIDRRVLIVALGGGVVGDLAGFVAATVLRGVDFVNVPTTLLADVDASVGGKTGIDAAAGKNLIGAFHQPRAVLIDPQVLRTLPPRQLSNGLAECVKHAVIADASLLEFIEDRAADLLTADSETMIELIVRNVAVKAAVVAADERESGQRAWLNFGHTVAHAIETAAGYDGVLHGEAVALGMTAACAIAVARGLIEPDAAERVAEVLRALSLPTRFADLRGLPAVATDPARLMPIMHHDKKSAGGVVRFVLPTNLGNVAVFDDVTDEQIAAAVRGLRA